MANWLSRNLMRLGALDAMENPLSTPSVQNSVHHFLQRAAGYQIDTGITLDADATTASENIFQIIGTIYIQRLFAIVTDATTLVNCTAASFDLFPTGGAAVQITAATGVLSGVALGTVVAKTGLLTDPFTVSDAVGAVISEQTYEGSGVFNGFLATQKLATDTFIRFTYTTTDSPIAATLQIYAEYRPLNGGSLVAV
jgi:hypothetical protein